MNRYRVTMRHDHGTVVITTAAQSEDQAAHIVCVAEGAPRRSVVSVALEDGSDGR